ncbi:hypothetical protein CGC48_00845 [Capnocytophaga cynodegmi]|uniref:Uncharacterized protein n=2 Tax=Capnocytophaga cynodegmi TaxID=28189 RepID=A0A286NTF3_9FLAO|nr:hypothetical protein CGC48_00845 [Capnocytophaga cynodegmi]
MLIAAILSSVFINKEWILIVIWIFFGISFIVYISLYIYFSLKKPDYLRSEKHQIMTQAIQVLGDNEKAFNPNMEHIANIMSPYSKLKDKEQNPLLK